VRAVIPSRGALPTGPFTHISGDGISALMRVPRVPDRPAEDGPQRRRIVAEQEIADHDPRICIKHKIAVRGRAQGRNRSAHAAAAPVRTGCERCGHALGRL
jgi:hypothetical protein